MFASAAGEFLIYPVPPTNTPLRSSPDSAPRIFYDVFISDILTVCTWWNLTFERGIGRTNERTSLERRASPCGVYIRLIFLPTAEFTSLATLRIPCHDRGTAVFIQVTDICTFDPIRDETRLPANHGRNGQTDFLLLLFLLRITRPDQRTYLLLSLDTFSITHVLSPGRPTNKPVCSCHIVSSSSSSSHINLSLSFSGFSISAGRRRRRRGMTLPTSGTLLLSFIADRE